jgi:hypothetical protein
VESCQMWFNVWFWFSLISPKKNTGCLSSDTLIRCTVGRKETCRSSVTPLHQAFMTVVILFVFES